MLATVATQWLLLMAAAATVINCSAMAKWIPDRKFRVTYPLIVVGCGLGMVAVGLSERFTVADMVTLYAFSLVGLTMALFPSRKLITEYAEEVKQGVTRDRYEWPLLHRLWWGVSLIGMWFAAALMR
jgi:hypothetical protein